MIGGVGLFAQRPLAGAGVGTGAFATSSPSTEVTPQTSFGDLLAAAAGHTVGSLARAEAVSVQALQGKADTREVVDAVMSAEQSLQAAIAIRDKIVSAYLDISRIAI
jgi:flagellar hook-basal body complex protein FliE